MKKSNRKTVENAKTEVVEKLYTVATVARDELNIDPKRARAYLRKNPKLYAPFRNKTFTASSELFKQCVDALTAYKTKRAPVTE